MLPTRGRHAGVERFTHRPLAVWTQWQALPSFCCVRCSIHHWHWPPVRLNRGFPYTHGCEGRVAYRAPSCHAPWFPMRRLVALL